MKTISFLILILAGLPLENNANYKKLKLAAQQASIPPTPNPGEMLEDTMDGLTKATV